MREQRDVNGKGGGNKRKEIKKKNKLQSSVCVITRTLDFLSVKREINPSSLSGLFSASLLLLRLLSPFKHRKNIYTQVTVFVLYQLQTSFHTCIIIPQT